jgi:hypothetical protein
MAATSELVQAQHELASRASNQFIASRLANAKQQDQDARATQQQQQQSRPVSVSPGSRHWRQPESGPREQPTGPEGEHQQQHPGLADFRRNHRWSSGPAAPEHEDSDSSTVESERNGAARAGHLMAAADQSAGKSHVGPMGIFFKVWSLVKGKHTTRHDNS